VGGPALARTQLAPMPAGEPSISGNTVVGSTLTATQGTWTNSPTSFTYDWRRCPASGGLPDASDCPSITGATTTSYVLTTADVGSRLRIRVTATNTDGSATAASNATELVTAPAVSAPVNTILPAITGTAAQGQTLTASSGTWTGSPTSFAYQWLRCDASSSNCVTISGATTSSYVPGASDVSSRLRVRVTATNSGGSTAAQSATTAVVTGSGGTGGSGPPVNTSLPAITGTAARGRTLSASAGTWTGAPTITFTYQWLRCEATDTTDCEDIGGATSQTYVLVTADVGKRIRVEVNARNSLGTDSETSAATAVVTQTTDEDDDTPQTTQCDTSIPGALQVAGRISIPSTSVSLPEQLVAIEVRFSPNPVRSRGRPFRVVVRVEDTRGCLVRDALVLVRSVPIVTSSVQERPTGRDGTVSANLTPRAAFPLKDGGNVQFFIRVRKPGDPVLTGVGTRRLVQVGTEAP
jgi:hypothetical protein